MTAPTRSAAGNPCGNLAGARLASMWEAKG